MLVIYILQGTKVNDCCKTWLIPQNVNFIIKNPFFRNMFYMKSFKIYYEIAASVSSVICSKQENLKKMNNNYCIWITKCYFFVTFHEWSITLLVISTYCAFCKSFYYFMKLHSQRHKIKECVVWIRSFIKSFYHILYVRKYKFMLVLLRNQRKIFIREGPRRKMMFVVSSVDSETSCENP